MPRQQSEMARLLGHLIASDQRPADLARLLTNNDFSATTRQAYDQHVRRLLARLEKHGVVASSVRQGQRWYRLENADKAAEVSYNHVNLDGQRDSEARETAYRRRAERAKPPPLNAGCLPGDRFTSKGQPFVCVGAEQVATSGRVMRARRRKKKDPRPVEPFEMAVTVWRSVCAAPGCSAEFDQNFTLRFPSRVRVGLLRNCAAHRGNPVLYSDGRLASIDPTAADKFDLFRQRYTRKYPNW